MKLLSLEQLKSEKGIPFSKPHLWRLIKANKFVKPVKVGEKRIGFIEAEVDAWLETKAAQREEGSIAA
jgi:prophage regulatory protein